MIPSWIDDMTFHQNKNKNKNKNNQTKLCLWKSKIIVGQIDFVGNFISSVFVHGEYRRRGLGTFLVLLVGTRFVSSTEFSVVEIDDMTSGENDFYDKMGFTWTNIDKSGTCCGPERTVSIRNLRYLCRHLKL